MSKTLLVDSKQTPQNPLRLQKQTTQNNINTLFVVYRTVAEWNTWDNEAVHAGSVDAFKAKKNI